MSTFKEIAKSKTTIMLKPKENIVQSVFKDLVTFSMIAFCVYISQGSTWWTFVTGGMFLFYALSRIGGLIKNSATTFKTVKEAKEYLDNLKV